MSGIDSILPDGVTAKVFRMRGVEQTHQDALNYALFQAIKYEAAVHEAAFDAKRFDKVIEAVKENKIQAWFVVAGWENCAPRFAGVAIEFPTVYTERAGNSFIHYPAVYGEDTSLFPAISKEFRQRTKTEANLKGIGLGSWFEQERIRIQSSSDLGPFGMVPQARIGEYFGSNAAIVGMMSKFGAKLATTDEAPVLKLDGLTEAMRQRLVVPVDIGFLQPDPTSSVLNNVFLTDWSNQSGSQKVSASFTDAFSTFIGNPVVRVQITSNGNAPNSEALKDVLVSLLRAGSEEVRERRWGLTTRQDERPSPIIPAGGTRYAILNALMDKGKRDLLKPNVLVFGNSGKFGGPVPVLHIHAPGEPEIISALRELGASIRTLGPHAMLPGIMDFRNIPAGALGYVLPPARPLLVTSGDSASSQPILALAA